MPTFSTETHPHTGILIKKKHTDPSQTLQQATYSNSAGMNSNVELCLPCALNLECFRKPNSDSINYTRYVIINTHLRFLWICWIVLIGTGLSLSI